jgi:hypothetical protein
LILNPSIKHFCSRIASERVAFSRCAASVCGDKGQSGVWEARSRLALFVHA